ncbi:tRNA pseudouridine synthase A, mitochondrial, partial [Paramuricea clavata]
MENDKNVDHEEIKEQESAKRAIEEVDDDSKNIDERNKKLKSENTNKTDHDPDPMTCDLVENDKSEKTDEINVEKKEDGGQKKVKPKINYSKKKKCVLLLSYCGSGYNGMQRNPGVKTIEEDLTNALFKARAISEDASRNYGKHMVPFKELLPDINKHLEPKIRVFALKQVTRGFDCKTRCSSRTYEYILPTFAFSPTFAHTTRDFRITNEILNELKLVLKKYEGTKNFHNFTSGKDFKEESAKRYIIRFQVASEPFLERNMEFLVLQVQGQSFMQHQIRKMI